MKTIPLLPFLLLFSLLLSPSLSDLCNPTDKKVLLRIKKAFNDPYILASWNPNTDCCDWYTVECDSTTHRIISLTIFSGDLPGVLPPDIGDLPYLQTLEFHKLSNLTGPIQPAIVKLKKLQVLRISWTNISGSVPSFLSQLKNLTFLDLSFNDLTGSIPPELSQLPNLNALHLDRNKLTGQIPISFGSFNPNNVPELYLSHNQLSGKIPTSLGKMDFNVIDLSRNKLEGDASMLFGSNKTTQIVNLNRNLLSFNFSKVVFPASLTSLDISHNKITGGLPKGLAALDLQFLNVSYNRLCGPIPVGGKLQSFDYSSYFHNRCLCGAPLAACK